MTSSSIQDETINPLYRPKYGISTTNGPCRPNHSLLQYSLLGPACVFLRRRILKMYYPKQMTIQRIQNQGKSTNFAPKM